MYASAVMLLIVFYCCPLAAADPAPPVTGQEKSPAVKQSQQDTLPATTIPAGITFAELKQLPSAKTDWKPVDATNGWTKIPPILLKSSFVGPFPSQGPAEWKVSRDGLVVIVAEMHMRGNWPPQAEIDVLHKELEPKGWRAVAMLTVTGRHAPMPCSVLIKQSKMEEEIVFQHQPFGDFYLVRCDAKVMDDLRVLASKPAVALENPLLPKTRRDTQPPGTLKTSNLPTSKSPPTATVRAPAITVATLKSDDGQPIAWERLGNKKTFHSFPTRITDTLVTGPFWATQDPQQKQPSLVAAEAGLALIVIKSKLPANFNEHTAMTKQLESQGLVATGMYFFPENRRDSYLLVCGQLDSNQSISSKVASSDPYYVLKGGQNEIDAIRGAVPLDFTLGRMANAAAAQAQIAKLQKAQPAGPLRFAVLSPGPGVNAAAWTPIRKQADWTNVPEALKDCQLSPVQTIGQSSEKGGGDGPMPWVVQETGVVVIAVPTTLAYDTSNVETDLDVLRTELKKEGWQAFGKIEWHSPKAKSRLVLILSSTRAAGSKVILSSSRFTGFHLLKCDQSAMVALQTAHVSGTMLATANSIQPVVPPSSKPAIPIQPSPSASKSPAPAPMGRVPTAGSDGLPPKAEDCPILPLPPATPARSTQASAATERFALAAAHARDNQTPILNREIVRQALLLSVREEFGLKTHDASLREFKSGQAANKPPLDVNVIQQGSHVNGEVQVTIFRDSNSGPQILWNKKITPRAYRANQESAIRLSHSTDWLIWFSEGWSRNEFKELLTQDGLKAQTRKITDTPVDKKILDRFGKLDEYSQFVAVRSLHETILQSGETPERLELLARAYANLGSLTHRLFSAHSQVFFARGLLYAERLRARQPHLAASYWTRAYVNFLAGRHSCAEMDLNDAERILQASLAKGGTTTMPSWTKAIRAACAFSEKELIECGRADQVIAPLADYLLLVMRSLEWSHSQRVEAAVKVLERNANTLQAYEMCSERTPLGIQRLYNEAAIERQPIALVEALKTGVELTTALRRLVRSDTPSGYLSVAARQRMQEQLQLSGDSSADTGEPSWRCLATLTEEIQFLQMYRHCRTYKNLLGLPAERVLDPIRPLLKDHPHYTFLDSLCQQKTFDDLQLKDAIRKQDFTDAGGAHEDLATWLDLTTERKQVGANHTLVGSRQAVTYLDIGNRVSWSATRRGEDSLVELREVSPKAPLLTAVELRFGIIDQQQLAEVERKFSDSYTVQSALWSNYKRVRQFADAIRCGERLIAIAPQESVAYRDLAALYLQQDDREKWKSTLDRFLTVESYGLEDDRVRVDIAAWLMKNKKYAEAKPYAYEAAKCYSRWALECAASCSRHLEDWDMTQECLAALTDRYSPKYAYGWFLLCHEIGHQNAALAAPIAQRELLAAFEKTPFATAEPLILFLNLNGQKKQAIEAGVTVISKSSIPQLTMITALLADESGEVEIRDKLLSKLADQKVGIGDALLRSVKPQPDYKALANRFRKMLAAGQQARLDVDEYEKYIKTTPAITHDLTHYYVGWFLLNRNDQQTGLRYLKLTATSPDLVHSRSHARAMLNARKTNPGKIRPKVEE